MHAVVGGSLAFLLAASALEPAYAEPSPPAQPATQSEARPPPPATQPPSATSPAAPVSPEVRPPTGWFDRRVSAASVAAVYGVFATWAYFAWFRAANERPFFLETKWSQENPFALRAYAGGADKWGHGWASYALTRGTSELLIAGGWRRFPSSLFAAGLAGALSTLQEIKDGWIWGFEVGDFAADLTGAAVAAAMENLPAVDRLFDFRLRYFPSADFRQLAGTKFWSRGDGIDVAQDYSGMSFQLALHLGALPNATIQPWLSWLAWVDVIAGFETRGYSPPPMPRVHQPYQRWYLGVGINLQHALDTLLRPGKLRSFGHGVFEVLSLPGTDLQLAGVRRTWANAPTMPAVQ